jgi:hypothetical protein
MKQASSEMINKISKKQDKILDGLDYESINVYEFLRKRFRDADVASDSVFQFIFRSFYRMDNAGLTPKFKTDFFCIMQEYREKNFDMKVILRRLGAFKTLRGFNSVQLAFVSKMYNMIREDRPIYDSYIAKIFGLGKPCGNFDEKINRALHIYEEMERKYDEISSRGDCSEIIRRFDDKFKGNALCPIKKLDFIFWSAGKLMT